MDLLLRCFILRRDPWAEPRDQPRFWTLAIALNDDTVFVVFALELVILIYDFLAKFFNRGGEF